MRQLARRIVRSYSLSDASGRRGKANAQFVSLERAEPARSPSRTMVIFVPCSAEKGKPWQEWLLRQCPRCGRDSIVGHGRRVKGAHDKEHAEIRIRRGICRPCHVSFTFLPLWSLPGTHYSLYCRRDSLRRYSEGHSAEQAGAAVRDPGRLPDASTVLRWVGRRITALLAWSGWEAVWRRTPTILAWDCSWLGRTLNFARGWPHGPPVSGSVEGALQLTRIPGTA